MNSLVLPNVGVGDAHPAYIGTMQLHKPLWAMRGPIRCKIKLKEVVVTREDWLLLEALLVLSTPFVLTCMGVALVAATIFRRGDD